MEVFIKIYNQREYYTDLPTILTIYLQVDSPTESTDEVVKRFWWEHRVGDDRDQHRHAAFHHIILRGITADCTAVTVITHSYCHSYLCICILCTLISDFGETLVSCYTHARESFCTNSHGSGKKMGKKHPLFLRKWRR